MKHTTTKQQPNNPPARHYTTPRCLSWQEWDKVPAKNRYKSDKNAMYITWTARDGRNIFTPVILV